MNFIATGIKRFNSFCFALNAQSLLSDGSVLLY